MKSPSGATFPFVVRSSTVGASVIVLTAAACGSCGGDSSGPAGKTGGGKPRGFRACYDKYFSDFLHSCSGDDECGALSCTTADSCVTCSDKCRGVPCSRDSDCAAAYDDLCESTDASPLHFKCMRANSLDEAQCNIAAGEAPKCTGVSGAPGC